MVDAMGSFDVRRCSFRNLRPVFRLHCSVFPSPYSFWQLLYYKIRFPRYFLVACWEKEIVGYIIGGYSYVWRKGRIGEIISLATDSRWRRQGIAERLLTQVLEEYRSSYFSEVYLQVAVSNIPAQHLYRKLGFQRDKLLPGYYSNGEDAILLRKSLDAASLKPSSQSPFPAS